MATLGKKYIYLNGESWMVKGPGYSQKVRKFMFKTFGGNDEALQEAMKWRDQEEDKLKEIQNGQIVLQTQFEDQQKKLRELQDADYRRLKDKERLELLAIEKEKKAKEDAEWVASEQKLDLKLWKVEMKNNYDYWKEKYPEEAATEEGKDLILHGYIASNFLGKETIPSIDKIQKSYLLVKKYAEQRAKGIKLTIKDVFRKDQIILV
jgi:hypothetical protein